MRCKNCPALTGTGENQYCCLGVEDDELLEDQKGDLGCNRRSKAKILKDIGITHEEENKAVIKSYGDIVEFMEALE